MAKHSKWHNIKHKKQKADKRRAKKFAKLAKQIVVAAREGGGDPEFNFSLRMAIDNAKAENMPKDNIERAILRGTGEGEEGDLETVVYEAYGPGNIGMMVTCLTDNRNRTVAEVKYIISQHDGKLADVGSVEWMFKKRGLIRVDMLQVKDRETFSLHVIEAGAMDLRTAGKRLEIICAVSDLQNLVNSLEDMEVKVTNTKIAYIPQNTLSISEKAESKLKDLTAALEENDDVEDIFTNVS